MVALVPVRWAPLRVRLPSEPSPWGRLVALSAASMAAGVLEHLFLCRVPTRILPLALSVLTTEQACREEQKRQLASETPSAIVALDISARIARWMTWPEARH